MNTSTAPTTVLLAESRHEAPEGALYAVRTLGVQRLPGVVSSRRLEIAISRDGGRSWAALAMRVCPLHLHRAAASDWPPPVALAVSISDGRLALAFDNVYDPWEKTPPTALQAHARWLARYDPRWRWWTLHQQQTHDPEAIATR